MAEEGVLRTRKYLSSEPVSLTIQPLMLGRDLKGFFFLFFIYTYGDRGVSSGIRSVSS